MIEISIGDFIESNPGKGIMLLPPETSCVILITLRFHPDGRWNIDQFTADMESGVQKNMGLSLDLRPAVKPGSDFLKQVQAGIIAECIRTVPNILEEFELDGSPCLGSSIDYAVPLIMTDTGRRLTIKYRLAENGEPDCREVVSALENCYREVFYLDSGREVFSAGQRNAIRENGPAWLMKLGMEAGVALPEVELDTESGAWSGEALQLWVKVPFENDAKYSLLIPVSERGEPDYQNIDSVAREISAGWAARFSSKNAEMFYDKIKSALRPQVQEYVEWIIEEERKIRQAFWDELSQELDKKLKQAEELEKKAVAAREQLRKSARDLVKIEAKPVDARSGDTRSQLEITITKTLEGLAQAFGKISEGVSKLPGEMHKAISNSEIMKGLEFGFRAAGLVVEETVQIVLYDIASALLSPGTQATAKLVSRVTKAGSVAHRAFNYISSPSKDIDILSGRLLTAIQIYKNYSGLKESAELINSKIVKIKNEIFLGNQSDFHSN